MVRNCSVIISKVDIVKNKMPRVGKKHFGYNPKGKVAAQKEAAKTGKEITHAKTKRQTTSDGYMPKRKDK